MHHHPPSNFKFQKIKTLFKALQMYEKKIN